jgi:hypothetical protein
MSRRKPSTMSWNIKQINTMIQKGTIRFDHPLQRPAGQWKQEDKSLLIDSLLTLYCPDVFAIKEKTEKGNTYNIIDGLQRLSSIHEFLIDGFELTKLESFCLEATGNEIYNITGKKFSELPEEVQNEIMGYTLGLKVFEIEEGDDEENIIEEIFYRLNNGKGMSREHKALVRASHKVQKFCHKIATEHKLFTDLANYSESATKKSDKQMTIMQTLLLMAKMEYESFAAKHVEEILSKNDITDQVLEQTEKAFTAIVEAFKNVEEKKVLKFVAKVNIPVMAYVFANSLDHAETAQKLLQYVKESKPGDRYKVNTGSGNVKKEKVIKRVNVMMDICGVLERNIIIEQEQQEQMTDNEQDQNPQKTLSELESEIEEQLNQEPEEQDQELEEYQDELFDQDTQEGFNNIVNIINNQEIA